MMKYLFRIDILIIFIVSILFSSCASDVSTRIKNVESLALENGFQQQLVYGGDFIITTYQRIADKYLPYVFYIEGDGQVSVGRSISTNPTPSYPMLMRLAMLDDRPNVVYIARPCQYTSFDLNPKCNYVYWTTKRMANEIIDSINLVINSINNGQKFSLVGFSGGGGVAILIAARNNNVKDIITIAGNLDHISFSEYHNAQSMVGSLNPIDYSMKINNIPQLHLSGVEDTRVPSFIADKYVKMSSSHCVKQKIFPHVKHMEGWDIIWHNILKMQITCTPK